MPRKQTSETDIIHADWWDADETITIRKYLTHGMQKAINQAYASTATLTNPDDPTSIKVDPTKALEVADVALLHWIVDWTFKDAQGNPLSFDQASIDSLAEEDIKFINDEIGKRSNMTEAEQSSFLPKPQDGTEG